MRNSTGVGRTRRRRWAVAVGAVALGLVAVAALAVLPRGDAGLEALLAGPSEPDAGPGAMDPEALERYHEGIGLRARETEVAPEGSEGTAEEGVTAVWVEVDNATGSPLVVQAGAFVVTDTRGLSHEPAPGVDAREIGEGAMVRLEPGEGTSGVVTARGDFTPQSVDFYPDNSGVPVTVQLDARV